MKKTAIRLLLSLSMVSFLYSQINCPKYNQYDNPYDLLFVDSIKSEDGIEWIVFANQDDAPIYAQPRADAAKVARTIYLQTFRVHERKEHYLRVEPIKRSLTGAKVKPEKPLGWIDMRALILQPGSITNPDTSVRLKAFFRVVIKEDNQTNGEKGTRLLRFRQGPGPGSESASSDGHYQFVGEESQTVSVGNVISYIYGVHFKDGRLENYRDVENFKNADYYFIGDVQTFREQDRQNQVSKDRIKIRGWIPSSVTVIWDTRQALEPIAKANSESHIFAERKQLLEYFDASVADRNDLLNDFKGKMVLGSEREIAHNGQELRPIILDQEHLYQPTHLYSESIGFSGNQKQFNGGFLASVQEGGRNLDLMFLVDATRSMRPCLDAAAAVSESIVEQLRDQDLEIHISSAVFRDELDGSMAYARSMDNINPAQWLKTVPDFSSDNDRDYQENLYAGISRALDDWHFSHPYSVRILIVLGDSGDNGRGTAQAQVIEALKQKHVLPLAIAFLHPYTKQGDKGANLEESQAMKAFPLQMDTLLSAIYGQGGSASEWRTLQLEAGQLREQISRLILASGKSIGAMIRNMPNVRLGLASFKEVLCQAAFERPADYDACMACKNTRELEQRLSKNVAQQGSGLILAYLENLSKNDPELWKTVMEKPELGFQQGFTALKQDKHYFARPILLLAQSELQLMSNVYKKFLKKNSACNNEAVWHLMIAVISQTIGEFMDVKPGEISIQRFQNWQKKVIDRDGQCYGEFTELLKRVHKQQFCDDPQAWAQFHNSVETCSTFIHHLLNPRASNASDQSNRELRLYRDLQGYKYYWVYPEEIFPKVGVGR